ncbi:flagellar basal body P-ring formation chaperone FlgA [Wenxinia saemankumensis]|uniref:Flagella basal body P-ring formation protein FlgA n=1 Tax=Wenxinia saemankumensis TaxID=1447782 RepID=A0A1M6G668_9RHOB|nr:flagellar basal body P-ring formation chaperone FlgA [Wenxinia saemankumensis]SHJ05434.1 flagella basal body P-ring formation protein FlgA [Wenxinia saemankumensis]
MRGAAFLLALAAGPGQADILVAARTIPAETVLAGDDVTVIGGRTPGALTRAEEAVGLEAAVALYAGRPIHAGDLVSPAVVDRNQIIPLVFSAAGLVITTEGRALDRGGPGDAIRVMNLASRTTITAVIDETGTGHVTN